MAATREVCCCKCRLSLASHSVSDLLQTAEAGEKGKGHGQGHVKGCGKEHVKGRGKEPVRCGKRGPRVQDEDELAELAEGARLLKKFKAGKVCKWCVCVWCVCVVCVYVYVCGVCVCVCVRIQYIVGISYPNCTSQTIM